MEAGHIGYKSAGCPPIKTTFPPAFVGIVRMRYDASSIERTAPARCASHLKWGLCGHLCATMAVAAGGIEGLNKTVQTVIKQQLESNRLSEVRLS